MKTQELNEKSGSVVTFGSDSEVEECFTVSFHKVGNQYRIGTYAGTNEPESRQLLMWALVTAEMTNVSLTRKTIPANTAEHVELFTHLLSKVQKAVGMAPTYSKSDHTSTK